MEGYICVNENRQILEMMKEKKLETLKHIEKNHFKEKLIDKSIDIAKGVVTVAGAALTVVMAVCPFDGPVGEIATVLATPALVKAIESSRNLLKATFVEKNSENISGALIDVYGNVKQINLKDYNFVQNTKSDDAMLEKSEVGFEEFTSSFQNSNDEEIYNRVR